MHCIIIQCQYELRKHSIVSNWTQCWVQYVDIYRLSMSVWPKVNLSVQAAKIQYRTDERQLAPSKNPVIERISFYLRYLMPCWRVLRKRDTKSCNIYDTHNGTRVTMILKQTQILIRNIDLVQLAVNSYRSLRDIPV